MSEQRARAVAFYLPQFHPIKENDEWWGRGFTEWTNTAKAKPLFRGHYQPHVPADLGFYDLRLAESRMAQAEMARAAGLEGFCYYHYWFAGRRILERPFNEVLASGQPDFPFCLCWANESWTGIWHGAPGRMLIEQTYPGTDDHRAHFDALLPAFLDRRYIRVDGQPVFLLYKPEKLLAPQATLALWRDLAAQAGLPGLHIVGITARTDWNPEADGFDAKVLLPLVNQRPWVSRRQPLKWLRQRCDIARGRPVLHDHGTINKTYLGSLADHIEQGRFQTYPSLTHAWDNTPRSRGNGVVLTGSSPALFGDLLDKTIRLVERSAPERRLIFLKSWNEWAEGNHLEPDLRDGHGYLNILRTMLRG